MIRRTYEFTEDKMNTEEQNSLMHHGRKGMKWYKHIFADTADRLGKAAENLKTDKKYDVSQETKDIASGKYGKKEDGKTDDKSGSEEKKDSSTTLGGAAGGSTDKKDEKKEEEKTEVEKLQEEVAQLKQQLAQAQQSTTTTTTRPAQTQQARQQPNPGESIGDKAGQPISGGAKAKPKMNTSQPISAKIKDEKGEALSEYINKDSAKTSKELEGKVLEAKKDAEEKKRELSSEKNKTLETNNSSSNTEKANTIQNAKTSAQKLEEMVNKTNELSQQLKRSEERITLLEELLKKYEKR